MSHQNSKSNDSITLHLRLLNAIEADDFDKFSSLYSSKIDSVALMAQAVSQEYNLPFPDEIYQKYKKYFHFLVEKNNDIELIEVLIFQKDDKKIQDCLKAPIKSRFNYDTQHLINALKFNGNLQLLETFAPFINEENWIEGVWKQEWLEGCNFHLAKLYNNQHDKNIHVIAYTFGLINHQIENSQSIQKIENSYSWCEKLLSVEKKFNLMQHIKNHIQSSSKFKQYQKSVKLMESINEEKIKYLENLKNNSDESLEILNQALNLMKDSMFNLKPVKIKKKISFGDTNLCKEIVLPRNSFHYSLSKLGIQTIQVEKFLNIAQSIYLSQQLNDDLNIKEKKVKKKI